MIQEGITSPFYHYQDGFTDGLTDANFVENQLYRGSFGMSPLCPYLPRILLHPQVGATLESSSQAHGTDIDLLDSGPHDQLAPGKGNWTPTPIGLSSLDTFSR